MRPSRCRQSRLKSLSLFVLLLLLPHSGARARERKGARRCLAPPPFVSSSLPSLHYRRDRQPEASTISSPLSPPPHDSRNLEEARQASRALPRDDAQRRRRRVRACVCRGTTANDTFASVLPPSGRLRARRSFGSQSRRRGLFVFNHGTATLPSSEKARSSAHGEACGVRGGDASPSRGPRRPSQCGKTTLEQTDKAAMPDTKR